MRAYIDADILIWHLRGERKAMNFLRRLRDGGGYDLWIGAMQRAVVSFMRPEEEDHTLLFLAQFQTAGIDQALVDEAGSLYRQWNPSHGIDPNDALLAAAAKQTGGRIFCLNRKHYPMSDVLVEKTCWGLAWVHGSGSLCRIHRPPSSTAPHEPVSLTGESAAGRIATRPRRTDPARRIPH